MSIARNSQYNGAIFIPNTGRSRFGLDYSKFDDVALIRQIALARPEALSALYDRYGRLVFSLALHIVGEEESAEEVTQDVFFRIWEKAEIYQAEQARVSTWLTSITRNRSIDLLRKRKVRPEGYSLGWEELQPGWEPASEGRTPEDMTAQKKALALAFFEGYSHSEIAERLGEPLGTVKTRIRTGMQKLRSLLHDESIHT
jgi:RNA polymerase sigma-70 factor (ECF subfamily)